MIVDLSKKQVSLQLKQAPPENLAEILNEIPDQLITVSNTYKSTATPLMPKQSASSTESVARTKGENSKFLTFEIVKLSTSANFAIGISNNSKKAIKDSATSGIERKLEDNVRSFKPGSVHVDLDKKQIRLQADQNDAELIVRNMNDLGINKITVADLPNDASIQMKAQLESARGTAPLKHSVAFEIKKIEAGLEKQIAIDPTAGAKALTEMLNFQLQQSISEYIPDTVKLDLEYRKMTIHLNQYPEKFLYTKINKIPSMPVNVIPVNNTWNNPNKELRTPEQLKPTQVTYRILSYGNNYSGIIQYSQFYNSNRNSVFFGLMSALSDKVTGYIPDTLDVNFVEHTVTFQLDHVPATDLGIRISTAVFNETELSALPISIGPPKAPFQTPGRPMRLVVLKINEITIANETFKNGQIPVAVQRSLKDEEFKLNSSFQSDLSNYIFYSTEIDPRQMLLAIQLDRIPPADLVKQINLITNSPWHSNMKIADEIVAVHEVEYDPDSSEKTLFFQFTNNHKKSPQTDEDYIRSKTNEFWLRVNRYIPNSLKMDFEQGTFSVRQRIGGIEKEEIADVVKIMNDFKLNVTHLNTTLPQTNKKAHPMGIGIVTGAGSALATDSGTTTNSPTGTTNVPVDQNVIVTIQYGLYGGRKKPQTSAVDTIKGFPWIDRKSLKVDAAKKEFTFKTTGPFNRGAIDRALKRNKFYKCIVKHEALTNEAEAKK